MQYMLMFYETPDQIAAREGANAQAHMAGWMAYIGGLYEAGVGRSGEGLLAPSTATTVRIRGEGLFGRRVSNRAFPLGPIRISRDAIDYRRARF